MMHKYLIPIALLFAATPAQAQTAAEVRAVADEAQAAMESALVNRYGRDLFSGYALGRFIAEEQAHALLRRDPAWLAFLAKYLPANGAVDAKAEYDKGFRDGVAAAAKAAGSVVP